jgi:ferritin-like metal-binding protein YciE
MKALPKMIQEAQSDALRAALSEHLEVAKIQAERIEGIAEELGTDPKNQKCKGMGRSKRGE